MLSRGKFLAFFSEVPPCQIVMEACGSAHHWGRQIIAPGHACKLIPPIYVKPFLKRQKNDSNDAAAIVEAAQRPTMRFVAVKSEEAQADAMLFRTRAACPPTHADDQFTPGPAGGVRRDRGTGCGEHRDAVV